MDTQQNPNEPSKPSSPGQGGQQDREREERERQRREREKQGGGQQGAAVNRGRRSTERTIRLVLLKEKSGGR